MAIRSFSLILLSIISAQSFALADCNPLKGCDKKFCEIENQLTVAREKNNRQQVSGLTKSLENTKVTCTNEGLKTDLLKKVIASKEDLAEYEDDLKSAEKDNKSKKVIKYQSKIKEKKLEIEHYEKELSAFN